MTDWRWANSSINVQRGRVIIDGRDVIEEIDGSGCALIGYNRDEVIGLRGSELVPLDAHAATAVSLDRMRQGEILYRSGRLRHKDGTILNVQVAARALPHGRLLLKVQRLLAD